MLEDFLLLLLYYFWFIGTIIVESAFPYRAHLRRARQLIKQLRIIRFARIIRMKSYRCEEVTRTVLSLTFNQFGGQLRRNLIDTNNKSSDFSLTHARKHIGAVSVVRRELHVAVC